MIAFFNIYLQDKLFYITFYYYWEIFKKIL